MKKFITVFSALCLVFVLLGCATDRPATGSQGGKPDWVLRAENNAPEGTIVGTGTAKLATTNQSMTFSENRARVAISRAMDSMMSNMLTDFTAANEVDPGIAVAFQQEITRALSAARLQGTRTVVQNSDRDGNWWTVMYFDQTGVRREISQAQAAARLAIPAMLAFNAEEMMDEQLQRAAESPWFVDN